MIDFSKKEDIKHLISKVIKGDEKSQKFLYEVYYGKFLALCCRYTVNIDEAKDILQVGMIKIFKSLHKFESSGSLEGWMRRIIINTAIDFIRQKKEFTMSDENYIERLKFIDNNDIEEKKMIELKAEQILEIIQELTPAYKAVFNLYAIENYTHKEVAEILGISIGTSKSNYAKAKQKILEIYNKKYSNKI